MEFATVTLLKDTIREYFIVNDMEFVFIANESNRVRVKCKAPGCKWMLFASLINKIEGKTMKVKKLENEHTCGMVFNNKKVNSAWLVKHFLDEFRLDPNMQYSTFRERVSKTKFSRGFSFYRAKRRAMAMLLGSVNEQYAILDDYCKKLLETNPGSTVKLKTKMACKDGWLGGCRPLIGLDGCFLTGYGRGILLAAIGIDGNNSMFPIAYSVVEKENTEIWTWFLEFLHDELENMNPIKITMMSDRQKGLEKAVAAIFIGCEVRFCVRHLHANFKKEYTGLLLNQLLWAAANTTTQAEFERAMAEIKEVSIGAYNWLLGKPPSQWSKSHISEYPKCDILLNNLCESFNAAILEARDKPIITLLEKIRFWLMSRFYNKKLELEKWTNPVGKRILKIIEKNTEVGKKCLVTRSGNYEFEVTCNNGSQMAVDLEAKTCKCRRFQLSGIPCGHALASIWFTNGNRFDYVHVFYKKESLEKTYLGSVHPMPSPNMWPKIGGNPIDPPPETKLPGRRKKARRRDAEEPPPGSKKARRT
ncbi:hypothetical protein CsatB_007589 [Cannabis sativa]